MIDEFPAHPVAFGQFRHRLRARQYLYGQLLAVLAIQGVGSATKRYR
jgi:hypothetical protein